MYLIPSLIPKHLRKNEDSFVVSLAKISMRFSSFFLFILTLGFPFLASANSVQCPAYTFPLQITADEAIAKIDACHEARKNGTANTITDYQCPSGEFVWRDQLPLTYERLAYHITVNLMINEADTITRDYMRSLMKFRNYDALAWTEHLRMCLRTNAKNPLTLEDIYAKICDFSYIQHFLNGSDRTIITTTQTYPQSLCTDTINRKLQAWESLGYALTYDGIAKTHQNDHDQFLNDSLGAYSRVLQKFHEYQRIVARAVSKMGIYIRDAVK